MDKICYNINGDKMCGRFTIGVPKEVIRDYLIKYYNLEFNLEFSEDFYLPRYNVAPRQKVLAIIHDGKNYRVGLLRWGFIPHFSDMEIINAKGETLEEKPSFKDAFQKRRCVILADGFYEWKKVDNKKIPFHFTVDNRIIFPIAGLYNVKTLDDGTKLSTCLIITTKANQIVSEVHDRMPVILTEEEKSMWLNPHNDINKIKSLLTPYQEKMTSYQVPSIVNNPKIDQIECIKKVL